MQGGCRDRPAAVGAAWSHPGTPSASRPRPEAAVPPVKPARRLALRSFGTISAAHGRVSAAQSPPANVLEARRLGWDRLDPQPHRASTTDSREPPWLRSAWSTRRRSRYLPFKPRPSSRDDSLQPTRLSGSMQPRVWPRTCSSPGSNRSSKAVWIEHVSIRLCTRRLHEWRMAPITPIVSVAIFR